MLKKISLPYCINLLFIFTGRFLKNMIWRARSAKRGSGGFCAMPESENKHRKSSKKVTITSCLFWKNTVYIFNYNYQTMNKNAIRPVLTLVIVSVLTKNLLWWVTCFSIYMTFFFHFKCLYTSSPPRKQGGVHSSFLSFTESNGIFVFYMHEYSR